MAISTMRRSTRRAVTAAGEKAKALASTIAPPVSVPASPTSSSSLATPDDAAGGSTNPASPPTLLFADEAAWEAWLEHNSGSTVGVWLKIGKKGCDVTTVKYDEALDVALCFGWIDGQRKGLDASFFLQRFTPRRKRSMWSKRNVDKIAALLESGRMRPSGQAEVDAAMADGRWQRAYSSSSTIEVPADFQTALDGKPAAAAFFAGLNKTRRYSFLWRLETTKRADTRRRKIVQFVSLLTSHQTL